MVSVELSEAAVDVLEILKNTEEEDVKKISKNFTNFLKENCSKTYVSNIDNTKPIKEMELKPKTQALLGLIYMKYWADEEGKIRFKQKIKENERIYQKELKAKYNVDNLFRDKKVEKDEIEQTADVPVVMKKETLIQKIINKIKNIFRR